MGEILAADRVKDLQDRYLPSSHEVAHEICLMADSHEALRARLERAEAALRRVHPDFIVARHTGYLGCRLCFKEAEREEDVPHAYYCPFFALGAAGERGEG